MSNKEYLHCLHHKVCSGIPFTLTLTFEAFILAILAISWSPCSAACSPFTTLLSLLIPGAMVPVKPGFQVSLTSHQMCRSLDHTSFRWRMHSCTARGRSKTTSTVSLLRSTASSSQIYMANRRISMLSRWISSHARCILKYWSIIFLDAGLAHVLCQTSSWVSASRLKSDRKAYSTMLYQVSSGHGGTRVAVAALYFSKAVQTAFDHALMEFPKCLWSL